jgi:CDP-glucose 4,6-dehydratase
MGAELTGYALSPPTNPSLFQEASVGEAMNSVIADIRDQKKLLGEIQKAQPEIVFHLAAQPLVRYSYNYPVETFATNLMGTIHLLEAIRNTKGVKAVVIVTTDKCYENNDQERGYNENDPMGGHDPYSSSKGCAELATAAYRRSYFNIKDYHQHGVAVATARAGNVIGGGDWSNDRLIPDILRAFERQRPVVIRNPKSTRSWQHVLEPLSGYLLLAQRLYDEGPNYAEGWNFGPKNDDAKPVDWILDQMVSKWNTKASWQLDVNTHPHEAGFLKVDISKAKSRLNWQPTWPLECALTQITQWHQAWLNKEDMQQICLREINEYSRDMKHENN